VTDAVLPENDLEGRQFIDYIEKFEAVADLPFEWIIPKIKDRLGNAKRHG